MSCVKYLTVTFPVGLPTKIDNPVPASQVRFQQFRFIERFCVEGSNKRSDRGQSSNNQEFFTDHTFRASTSSFSDSLKLNSTFPFVPRNSGRGGLTSGLASRAYARGGFWG